jgi:FKBP-type peptidyl-prolyl cis-trans isomerase
MMALFDRSSAVALATLLLVPGTLASCGDDPITGPRGPEDVEFAASLGVDLSQMTEVEEGLFIRTLQAGGGDLSAAPNTLATLDVTIWLADGTQALPPAGQGSSVETQVTAGSRPDPLAGLSMGVVGMFEGEIRQIVAGSELAWGEFGAEGVPPHSVVVMRVELLEASLPR